MESKRVFEVVSLPLGNAIDYSIFCVRLDKQQISQVDPGEREEAA